jgi:hypothetical protein
VTRVEVGYAGAALVLCALLALIYRLGSGVEAAEPAGQLA